MVHAVSCLAPDAIDNHSVASEHDIPRSSRTGELRRGLLVDSLKEPRKVDAT
jgi:hypothetical protein